jgi:hypothetical protein
MEVGIEVRGGGSEALHEGDRTALAAAYPPPLAGAATQRCEQGPEEEVQDLAGEACVVGHAIAERKGEREHPLAHGDLGKDAVDEVGGGVGHAPPRAGGAEAALAREGDQTVVAAFVAVQAEEAMSQHAAFEIGAERALDETGNGMVTPTSAGQEGLELRLDDAVEDALLGTTSLVALLLATAAGVTGMGSRRCERAHPGGPLPASYRARSAVSAPLRAIPVGIEAVRSRFRR